MERRGNVTGGMLALIAVGVLAVAIGVAWAVSSNGPYYAMPAWDQKLPASTRFVLLLDWSSQAVLDRETGLVWEQSPQTTTTSWSGARFQCTNRTTGGRKGWRVPSVHELASLVDPAVAAPGPTLPPGHPFTNVQSFFYWSVTSLAPIDVGPTGAWAVGFFGGDVAASGKATSHYVWCVRGGMNADAY